MDILLEGRRAAAATKETDLQSGAATLDRSQARNFSIPLSLTLGRRHRRRESEEGWTDWAAYRLRCRRRGARVREFHDRFQGGL